MLCRKRTCVASWIGSEHWPGIHALTATKRSPVKNDIVSGRETTASYMRLMTKGEPLRSSRLAIGERYIGKGSSPLGGSRRGRAYYGIYGTEVVILRVTDRKDAEKLLKRLR